MDPNCFACVKPYSLLKRGKYMEFFLYIVVVGAQVFEASDFTIWCIYHDNNHIVLRWKHSPLDSSG